MVGDAKTDKLIRRTAMVGTVTAAYFLLTADYGSREKALDPIKRVITSAEFSVKRFLCGADKEKQKSEKKLQEYSNTK